MKPWDFLLIVALVLVAAAAGLMYPPAGIAAAGVGFGVVWNLFAPGGDR